METFMETSHCNLLLHLGQWLTTFSLPSLFIDTHLLKERANKLNFSNWRTSDKLQTWRIYQRKRNFQQRTFKSCIILLPRYTLAACLLDGEYRLWLSPLLYPFTPSTVGKLIVGQGPQSLDSFRDTSWGSPPTPAIFLVTWWQQSEL